MFGISAWLAWFEEQLAQTVANGLRKGLERAKHAPVTPALQDASDGKDDYADDGKASSRKKAKIAG